MHTNTAGVNRKWAELQGQGSVFRFVQERKAKFKNKLQRCVNVKMEKGKVKYKCQCVDLLQLIGCLLY